MPQVGLPLLHIYIYIFVGLCAQVPLASAGFLNTLDKVYLHNQESLGAQLQWAQDLMTSWSEMDRLCLDTLTACFAHETACLTGPLRSPPSARTSRPLDSASAGTDKAIDYLVSDFT